MFDQNGLSLDQAPPITVVFRFFIFGALFGIGSGLFLAWQGPAALEPAETAGRIMTHLLTLGVMMSFMLGVLFQMLPVVAGVALQAPQRLSVITQVTWVAGVGALLWGFESGADWAFVAAALLLGGTLVPLGLYLLLRLMRLQTQSASSRGMIAAIAALVMVAALGFYLAGTLGGLFDGAAYGSLRIAHFSFGLYGWIALLIVAISFQVVEMFYVTPPHPRWMRSWLGALLLGLLLLSSLMQFWIPSLWQWSDPLIALLLAAFAGVTLRRFSQRKRPLTDATVWFWRLGLLSLILSLPALLAAPYSPPGWLSQTGPVFFAAFVLSVLLAMLYKIIPFLTWFHLNAQGYLTAPMMHEVIHPKTARKHLYIHLATLLVFAAGILWSPADHIAGALLAVSFGWLLYQILRARSLYRHTQRTGQKFEMPSVEQ